MAKNDKKNSPSSSADPTSSASNDAKGSVPSSGNKPTEKKTQESAAEQVISLFGGLRPMAGKLGIAVSTIQGWKARHHIPENRHSDILTAAKTHDIALAPALLAASGSQAASGETTAENADSSSGASAPSQTMAVEDLKSASQPPADTENGSPEKPAPRPVPPAPAKSGGIGSSLLSGLLSSAVIIAGLGGAAYVTKDRWQARVFQELDLVSAQEVTALNDRLSALEGQASEAGQADLTAALADVKAQLAQLEEAEKAQEARIAKLNQTSQNMPQTTTATSPGTMSSDGGTAGAGTSGENNAALAIQLQALETRVDQKLAALPDNNAAEAAAERARIQGLQAKIELLDEELTTVQKLLNRNESQLDNTADQLAGLRDTAGAVADLRNRLNASEKRLTTVENTALAASSQRAADAALALAVGQLREALRYSGGYSHELAGLQKLAKGNANLEAPLRVLEASADQGLPSLRQLKDDFAPVAQAIAATEVSSAAGTDWSQTVLKNLQDIVVVRPVGNVTGDSASAIAARAEVRLGDGDLAGAVSELSTLPEAARTPAAAWLKEAQQRLDAEAALDQLTRLSINRLAPNQPAASSSGSSNSTTEG